ncbi:MAG: flavodoxin domain-containing protein [Eubacteriales bacterium]|nr:flavodoxin domain-containing protein [Eubacteriales bacterium]
MKIAVIFATKSGTTRTAAQKLCEALQKRGAQTELCELPLGALPQADAYAVGGSLRMASWHKLTRAFVKAHEATLLQKPLALFVCRCGQDDTRALLKTQVSEALLSHARWADSVGGELDMSKQKGLDRFVASVVSKNDKSGAMQSTGVLPERLEALADALTQA